MSKLRVAGFSISLDGYGAGPNQSLDNPLGEHGTDLHQWFFDRPTFRKMHGGAGGRSGVDEDFAARSITDVGAWQGCPARRRRVDHPAVPRRALDRRASPRPLTGLPRPRRSAVRPNELARPRLRLRRDRRGRKGDARRPSQVVDWLLSIPLSRVAPDTSRRLARANAFLFATSLTIAGCGGKTDEPTDTGTTDAGPDDRGSDTSVYGEAGGTFDTGTDAKDGGPDDTGGGAALYGDPAPDTGPADSGADGPIYGDAPTSDGG